MRLIKKSKKEIVQFFKFAKDHRIKRTPHHWYKGVILLLFGWGLIAINEEVFSSPIDNFSTGINFVVQFTSGIVFLLIFGFFHQMFKHRSLNIYNYFRISKENEISGSAVLSTTERRTLIYIRGGIAALGYIAFQLAKVAIGDIDNSIIYSSDGLMYAIIAWWLLKVVYNRSQKIGIAFVALGLAIILYEDLVTTKYVIAFWGSVLGITSSLSLAIILVLTSVIIQHDYPIRLALYQCVCGFILSFILVAVLFSISDVIILERITEIKFLMSSAMEGILYASALICFFQAFYYVEPLIVAISSYSLDLYTIILGVFFEPESLTFKNLSSTFMIAIGTAILLREDYKEDKMKEETNE